MVVAAGNVNFNKSDQNSYWNCLCSRRAHANTARIAIAGGLSWAGGLISAYVPTALGINVGSALGGIGNALSTYLAWDTGELEALRGRCEILESRIGTLEDRIEELFKRSTP